MSTEVANEINRVLSTQDFFEWYQGVFNDYIQGDTTITESDIISDIKQMFSQVK